VKLIDRLLRRVGLARTSQSPFESYHFGTSLDGPRTVDVKFKKEFGGHRWRGAVDERYDVDRKEWTSWASY